MAQTTAHNAPLDLWGDLRTCELPEMIDLLAARQPKPKPAKVRAVSYEAANIQLFKAFGGLGLPRLPEPPNYWFRLCFFAHLQRRPAATIVDL